MATAPKPLPPPPPGFELVQAAPPPPPGFELVGQPEPEGTLKKVWRGTAIGTMKGFGVPLSETPVSDMVAGAAVSAKRYFTEGDVLKDAATGGLYSMTKMGTGVLKGGYEAGKTAWEGVKQRDPEMVAEGIANLGTQVAGVIMGGSQAKPAVQGAESIATRTAQGVGRAASNVKNLGVMRGLEETFLRKPEVAQFTVKDVMKLPPLAVSGAEDIFRAAAPVGKKPGFRNNLYAAAGDLAEIADTLDLSKHKGGISNPDMRARATVDAINNHLREMYQTERAPQIARNAENPVVLKPGNAASEALAVLEKDAAQESIRNVAGKASREPLTVAELDALEQAVSQEMAPYRKMTPQERATAGMTNRTFAALNDLHKELKGALNGELQARGEVGLTNYERRYAALSEVRNQLRDRVNAAELERISAPGRLLRGAAGGKAGIASASQASVANTSMGNRLQDGFSRLKASKLRADRGTAQSPTPVKGLLPAPQPGTELPRLRINPETGQAEAFVRMGSSGPIYQPIDIAGRSPAVQAGRLLPQPPRTTPPPADTSGPFREYIPFDPRTTPERMGRLLPAPAELLPPRRSPATPEMEVTQAQSVTARDPNTGKFKRAYTSQSGPSVKGSRIGEIQKVNGERWAWDGTKWYRISRPGP